MKYTAWCDRIASNFEKDNVTIEIACLDFSSLDFGI